MQDAMTMAPMMLLGFVLMIATVAVLVPGIVWLVRNLTGDRNTTGRSSAIEQLEVRYAHGEIDRDEYAVPAWHDTDSLSATTSIDQR